MASNNEGFLCFSFLQVVLSWFLCKIRECRFLDVFLCVNKELFIKAGGFAVWRWAPQIRRRAAALAPAAELAAAVQALGALWSLCSNEETLINILGSLFLHGSDKCMETQEESVGEFTIFSSFSTCWVLALAAGGWVELF